MFSKIFKLLDLYVLSFSLEYKFVTVTCMYVYSKPVDLSISLSDRGAFEFRKDMNLLGLGIFDKAKYPSLILTHILPSYFYHVYILIFFFVKVLR